MTTATAPAAPHATSRTRQRQPLSARQHDLAQIHQLAKALALDDDAYRDLMATVCGGVRSAALLDVSGRRRFIDHLRRCLGKPQAPQAGRQIARPLEPKEKLLWALWMQLADAGLVQTRTMQALSAYAHRQTGVSRVEWLTGAQADLVAESMKQWLKRGGAR